jgi:glycosyltransferase involved in cell wall biosynthesis
MTADAVGGVWTYALDLSRALEAHDVRVVLAVLGPAPSAAQRRDAARVRHLQLLEWSGRLEWMDDPWSDVAASGDWLLDVEQTVRPDLVHLNGFCHGVLPWRAPCLVTAHSCVRSWWRAVMDADPPPRFDRYAAGVRAGLSAAQLVVAPSQAMRACLEEHYGPLPHATVIANGRAPRRLRPAAKGPVILSAGRLWDRAKNVGAVDEAAQRLAWPVLVAGDRGEHVPGGAAQHLGSLTPGQLARWMQQASIYVAPALYEPFGLSVLEAARAGCALVLGDIASLREIWADAALFVPPRDHDALADTLQRLIDDGALRREMAARAGKRARRFTAARMAARYVAAYAALLTPPSHHSWNGRLGARLPDAVAAG